MMPRTTKTLCLIELPALMGYGSKIDLGGTENIHARIFHRVSVLRVSIFSCFLNLQALG
jgi:hypothetical protein